MSGVPELPSHANSSPPSADASTAADASRALLALNGAEQIVLGLVRSSAPGAATAANSALAGIRRAQAELHSVLRRLAPPPAEAPATVRSTGAPPAKRA